MLDDLVFEKVEQELLDAIYFKAGQTVLGDGSLLPEKIDDKAYSFITRDHIVTQIIKPVFREFFSRFPLKTDSILITVGVSKLEVEPPENIKNYLIGVSELTTGSNSPMIGIFNPLYDRYGYPTNANNFARAIQPSTRLNIMNTMNSLRSAITAEFNPLTKKLALSSTMPNTQMEFKWSFMSYNTEYVKTSRKQEFIDCCVNRFMINLIDLRVSVEDDSSVKFTMDTIRDEAKQQNEKILESWNINADLVYARL